MNYTNEMMISEYVIIKYTEVIYEMNMISYT